MQFAPDARVVVLQESVTILKRELILNEPRGCGALPSKKSEFVTSPELGRTESYVSAPRIVGLVNNDESAPGPPPEAWSPLGCEQLVQLVRRTRGPRSNTASAPVGAVIVTVGGTP